MIVIKYLTITLLITTLYSWLVDTFSVLTTWSLFSSLAISFMLVSFKVPAACFRKKVEQIHINISSILMGAKRIVLNLHSNCRRLDWDTGQFFLHHNFVHDGRYSERGWACTPHPHQPGLLFPSRWSIQYDRKWKSKLARGCEIFLIPLDLCHLLT